MDARMAVCESDVLASGSGDRGRRLEGQQCGVLRSI
jgi:hypothetical protein